MIGVDEIACLTDFGLKFDFNGKFVSFERFKGRVSSEKLKVSIYTELFG